MADGEESFERFYADAKVYWDNISPTVDGMLGGFEKISPTDINGSKQFLRPFLKVSWLFFGYPPPPPLNQADTETIPESKLTIFWLPPPPSPTKSG